MNEPAPKILALIPAYNESRHIVAVVKKTLAYLPVLVVDDGSADTTGVEAQTAGATLLRQHPNQGKGAALLAGFSQALGEGWDAVLTLDADGQHDPQEIPAFLKVYHASRADLIVGVRDFSQMPTVRRLANSMGTRLFSWAIGQHIPDNQSGYRLITRRLMEGMLASGERGFEFEVEMIVIAVRQGMRTAWVPIRTIYAGEKSHIRPGRHALNFARMIWRTRRSQKTAGSGSVRA